MTKSVVTNRKGVTCCSVQKMRADSTVSAISCASCGEGVALSECGCAVDSPSLHHDSASHHKGEGGSGAADATLPKRGRLFSNDSIFRLARVAPFAVYMLFVALTETASLFPSGAWFAVPENMTLLYPLKAGLVLLALVVFWKHYSELRFSDLLQWKNAMLSTVIGIGVYVAWINLNLPWARLGEPVAFSPLEVASGVPLIALLAIRLAGAALIVPVMEELFWRSFLMRYLISRDFLRVPEGAYDKGAFVIVSVLFALEHHLVVAGLVAGFAYSLVLVRTRSIMHCVLAHAVTNLLLGLHVLLTGDWAFW